MKTLMRTLKNWLTEQRLTTSRRLALEPAKDTDDYFHRHMIHPASHVHYDDPGVKTA